MRMKTAAAVTAATVALATAATGATSAQAAGGCATRWGSLAESGRGSSAGSVTGVRTGRHACFDRLVVDVDGRVPAGAYDVRYVRTVTQDGSGRPVPLQGGADLQVVVRAPAYDPETGAATYRPADSQHLAPTAGFRTFRQVAWAGSFEGQTTLGLGVRARLPFRVFVVPGPGTGSRMVVDVAHTW